MKILGTKRFENLMFPVADVKPEDDIIDKIPEVGHHSEFTGYPEKNRTRVFKYTAFLYDKNSDLIREYRDLDERKDAALMEAGFERAKNGEWPPTVEAIKNIHDDQFRKVILKYLELQNHMALDIIHYNEQLFSEYKELLMRPVMDASMKQSTSLSPNDIKQIYQTADFKKRLREECMAIKKDLDGLYHEVFADNDDMQEEYKKHRKSSPERIASV